MVNVVLGITPYGSFFFGFFPCMTNVRIWLYRSSDSKKIKNSAVESMRFVVTLDGHINPATSIIYPGTDHYRHEKEVLSSSQVSSLKRTSAVF